MKKLLSLIALSLMLCLAVVPSYALENEAKIGSTEYETLAEAVAAVPTDGTQTTITVLKDVENANGIVTKEGQNMIIDFAGNSFEVSGLVGSSGTQYIAAQLKRGSQVTLKNGTLTSDNAMMLVQSYGELTLIDMNLVGGEETYDVLSVNNGNVLISGNSNITKGQGDYYGYQIALDIFYWPDGGYNDGISVTFDKTFTGTVTGDILYGSDSTVTGLEWTDDATLTIENGTFEGGEIVPYMDSGNDIAYGDANISVKCGEFEDETFTYYADENQVVENEDGSFSVLCKHEHTEIIGAVEPTCKEAGYSGDVVCLDCTKGVTLGEDIPATNNHIFVDGVCSVCHEKEVVKTGDSTNIALYASLTSIMLLSCIALHKKRQFNH